MSTTSFKPFGVLLLALAIGGCSGRETLDTSYGKTGGTPGGRSVNGVSVLASMFKSAGHNVTTTTRFSPRLDSADTIVWVPNDFEPPSEEHRQYLEEWLLQGTGRTVIYIGRDYDAAVAYWLKAAPLAPPEQTAEFDRQRARAITSFGTQRMELPAKDTYARWFKLKAGGVRRNVTTLEGPWAPGIDPKKCEIDVATRFVIPTTVDLPPNDSQGLPEFDVLLASSGDPLATEVTNYNWNDGKIIVVTNGSFLLNLPLVNKEHRKLASKLINECTPSGNVAFVESEAGGPPISKKEAEEPAQTGFEMLVVWPLGTILLHAIVCLFMVCICLYPIFGRPRKRQAKTVGSESSSSGDFGKHLDALGELLSLTRDHQFATAKVEYYQQHVKRDSGVSHVGPPQITATAVPVKTNTPNS
ncbi:MAG TPA: DUF4350 domain-containing protein [Pirellulaceae bacterium]|nr:DUF4350 domain-containing protein [Pirellulaceae bacterium]